MRGPDYVPYIHGSAVESTKGWQVKGLCANSDTPEDWEVRPTDVIYPGYEPRALELCEGCPVFAECANFAANFLYGYSNRDYDNTKANPDVIRLSDYIFAGICFPLAEDAYEIPNRDWRLRYRIRLKHLVDKGVYNSNMERTLRKHREKTSSHKKFVEEKEGNEEGCH